ncbi:MAG: aminotransferase class IV [Candidatus Cyclobacteriaceae bacterium M3_2C_046]
MCLLLETISIVEGKPQNLEYHQARMDQSSLDLWGRTSIDLNASLALPAATRSGWYKARVIYNQKIQKVEFLPYRKKMIRRLKLVQDDTIYYDYKFENRQHLDRLASLKTGCDDILIIKNGFVTDACYANLVFEKNHQFFTPSTPLLKGTKRAKYLNGRVIQERIIKVEDLPQFNKVHLINAFLDLDDMVILRPNIIY